MSGSRERAHDGRWRENQPCVCMRVGNSRVPRLCDSATLTQGCCGDRHRPASD